MSCNCPGYEHMDMQGVVALNSVDNKKEAAKQIDFLIGLTLREWTL